MSDKLTPGQLRNLRANVDHQLAERAKAGESTDEGVWHVMGELLDHIDAIGPREITMRVHLDLLPDASVVYFPRFRLTLEKRSGRWHRAGEDHAYSPNGAWFPATVLHTP